MKIKEVTEMKLDEVVFKLSDRSITVKSKINNKTKAVINDIKRLTALPNNKKFEVYCKYKKINNEVNLIQFVNELYVDDEMNLYYIINQKHHEMALKLYNNGFVDEFELLSTKISKLSSIGVNILFLNVA